jgi:hypothetical protein
MSRGIGDGAATSEAQIEIGSASALKRIELRGLVATMMLHGGPRTSSGGEDLPSSEILPMR